MVRIHFTLVFFGLLMDQFTKIFANKSLSFFLPKVIIPKVLSFQLVHNYGAAYGILQNQRVFLLSAKENLARFSCHIPRRVIRHRQLPKEQRKILGDCHSNV